jgi:hypothetical protein
MKYTIDCTPANSVGGQIIINKSFRKNFYNDEDNIQYFEGCVCVGYMPDGDSFLFSQSMGYDKKEHTRTILCLSRKFLEETIKNFPKNNS